MLKIFLGLLIGLAVAPLAARAQAKLKDTLIMKDGTVLSGELKSLKSGRVEFDIDNITVVKIKYDKIQQIKGLSHSYRVETSDRKIYYGQIRRAEESGALKVQLPDSTVVIPLNHIAFITSFNNNSFNKLSGYISSGFTYARSSNSGRFTLDGLAHWQFKRTKTDLTGNMFISQTDTGWIRDRESLALSSYYLLNPWISVGGNLKYQRNFELGLARRFQEGIGAMVNMLNHNNFQIRMLSGIVVNQEKSIEGEEFPTQVEIPVNFYLEFFKFSKPEISINTTQTAYFSLTDAGRVRFDGDTRISWEIIDDLALSLQVYHNYDSRPPASRNRNWDYGTVFSLKYEF